MAWEKKSKYHWQESESLYIVCVIRINDVINYEVWTPNKNLKGFEQMGMYNSPDEAKEFCATHFKNRSTQ